MINVVAAVIKDENGKILITQRNLQKSQGGLWEFPGGKLEPNESAQDALKREIKEEFDADIEVGNYIGESIHHYPEKDIKLMFYKANLISEKLTLLEHESCAWITKENKDDYEFAGADTVVFDWL